MKQLQKTLYEQIGGETAVKTVVVKLYERILSDEDLIPFFENISVARLRASQNAFISMALGGPVVYSGQTLRMAHEKLVNEKGLADKHFDRVIMHVSGILSDINVDPSLIQDVLKIIEGTRSDVLCKKEDVGERNDAG